MTCHSDNDISFLFGGLLIGSVTAEPNFFAIEYADQVRETAQFVLSRLRHLKSVIHNPDNIRLIPQASQYEHWTNTSFQWLTIQLMILMDARETRDLIQLAYETEARLVGIVDGLEKLENLLEQRTGSGFEISKYLRELHLGNLSSQVYSSIDNALIHFMKCYFGKKVTRWTCACSTGIANDFRIGSTELRRMDILTVDVPEVEVTRTRLWSGLVHEAVHFRLQRTNDKSFPRKTRVRLDSLTSKLTRDLKGIGRKYAARRERISEQLDLLSNRQVFEIVCDICSTIVIGPAFVLGLLCYLPPIQERFHRHPPLAVRVEYLFDLLRRRTTSEKTTDWAKVLLDIQLQWRAYYRSYATRRKHREFVSIYLDLLRKRYESDLFGVAEKLVMRRFAELFTKSTWKELSDNIDKMRRKDERPQWSPIQLMNIPLLRRWMTYPQIVNYKMKPLEYRANERKLTSIVLRGFARLGRS